MALSSFDDKRYIKADGITTLPFGHYAIPQAREQGPSSSEVNPETGTVSQTRKRPRQSPPGGGGKMSRVNPGYEANVDLDANSDVEMPPPRKPHNGGKVMTISLDTDSDATNPSSPYVIDLATDNFLNTLLSEWVKFYTYTILYACNMLRIYAYFMKEI